MPAPSPTLRRSLAILTLAAACMAALLAYLPASGHDQLWLLYVADHVVGGAHLYGPTLMESNPPLIVWLTLIPAALARLTHLSGSCTGKALVLALQLALLPLCGRLLRRIAPETVASHRNALLFAWVVVFNVLPARDLGQRDYLLTLLVLPYLLAVVLRTADLSPSPLQSSSIRGTDRRGRASARPQTFSEASASAPEVGLAKLTPAAEAACLHESSGRAEARPLRLEPSGEAVNRFVEASLVGLLAAVGFALKPHQALVPIALELWLILHNRSARTLLHPEPLLLLTGAAIYPLLILRLTPDYLNTVLPLLRDTYWAFGHRTPPQLALDAVELCVLLVLTTALWWSGRRQDASREESRRRGLIPAFLLAAAAATLAYGLQGTGWYYQQLPALSFAAFALWLLLLPRLDRLPLPAWTPRAAAALSILAVALTTHFMGYPFTRDRSFPIDSPDPSLLAGLAPGTAVATLTTTVDDTVMPAEKFHFQIAQRYPHLWMLPAILRNETPAAGAPPPPSHRLSPERLAPLEATQHRFMLEDLIHWQPELVLVERCHNPAIQCQVLEDRHDDLLAWFRRDPAFDTYWQTHYRPAASRGAYDSYRLIHTAPTPASVQ